MAYKDKSNAIRYNNEFNKQNYDRISLLVPKGKKEVIQATAQERGESVNAYINRAIDILIEGGGGSFGFDSVKGMENDSCRSFSHTVSLSESEEEMISALLGEGQTAEEYIRTVLLERIQADMKSRR